MCAKKVARPKTESRPQSRKKTTAQKPKGKPASKPAGQTPSTRKPNARKPSARQMPGFAPVAPPQLAIAEQPAADSILKERVFSCIRSVVRPDEVVFGADSTTRSLGIAAGIPNEIDHRRDWWTVGDQKQTGSCVGWAVGDGLVRWHLTSKNRLPQQSRLSVRYFWMAAKETDEFSEEPTTFLEDAGTSVRSALEVARRFGCVEESVLPMSGGLFTGGAESFFALAERLKISGLMPVRSDPDVLRRWLAREGPVAGRLLVDQSFHGASGTTPLNEYKPFPFTFKMGHAVVLAGYRNDGTWIVRNSWGESWGDQGFAYVTDQYLLQAFTEFFGIYS